MPGCLLSGPISSQPQRGSMQAELGCLAAGQPSRAISVEAPLWSQVVGSAYREDQQRSVSPLRSLSLHLMPLFSLLSVFCPLPFWHYPPPPPCFPLKSPYFHLHLIIVILPFSHLPPILSFAGTKQSHVSEDVMLSEVRLGQYFAKRT